MEKEKHFGQVLELKYLIGYQDNSVVSKEILKKDSGSVTLFAFDINQGLSEHTAPFDALVQIIEGEAEVILSGQVYEVKDGQVIIMPANIPHAIKAKTAFKMMLVMIST